MKPTESLTVKTGVRAGQNYETRYGVVEMLPDQGGLNGMWQISNATYFTTPSTTYDMSGGPMQPGQCVEMIYDPRLGTIQHIVTGICGSAGSAPQGYQYYHGKNSPILTRNY